MDSNFDYDAYSAGPLPFPQSSPRQRANQYSSILAPSNEIPWDPQSAPFPTNLDANNTWAPQPTSFTNASPANETMGPIVFNHTSNDFDFDNTWASEPLPCSTAQPVDSANQYDPFFEMQDNNAFIDPSLLATQPLAFETTPARNEADLAPLWNANRSGSGSGMETLGVDNWPTHSPGSTLMQDHQPDGRRDE